MQYPTTFAETLTPITIDMLPDRAGQDALRKLGELGLGVFFGFRREDVPDISQIALEEGVVEFCPRDSDPNDPKARFSDEQHAEAWQSRGPGMFQLRTLEDSSLCAYSWTRPEKCEFIPDQETTFALRVSQALAGRGVGALMTSATVSASVALLGARNIGLETWASNTGAVKSYLKAGAELVTTKDDYRPTLKPSPKETDGRRRDVRLFMRFLHTFVARS